MFVTVAICTRNRAESLRRTLDSLAAMEVPNDLDWELVIVNNGSTDSTDEVIDEYACRLPLRRELEPQPGHSNARNRAIDATHGEYIVWTDDDVVADPGWLRAYAEAFRRWPEAAVFGGRIIPRYEPPAAKWVVDSEDGLFGVYAIRDFGDEVLPLSLGENRLPFGANFAVRTTEQRALRYDSNLGLAPDRRRLGDETDVVTQLLQAGASGYWLPGALVEHCISRERQTVRYVAAFHAGLGETDAFQSAAAAAPPMRSWLGAPHGLWQLLLKRWLRYRFHRVVSPAPVWVRHLQSYAHARGALRFWRQQRGQMSADSRG